MTNEQCSILNVIEGNYCRKGPKGCFEFGDCDNIDDVEVEPDICKELTKPDDDLQCIPSEIGCKKDKVKCLNNSLYIYDKIKCEKLDISSEDYKCLSNGKECIEVNSCDSINNTSYETNSNELREICELFDNCEPYKKGCKTESIPTTIITTIPTTIVTTVPITVPTTVQTTTIVTTKSTTILTTELDTIQTTALRTIPTNLSTTIPTSFSTNMPINLLNESTIIHSITSTTTPTAVQTHIDSTIQAITPKTTIQSIFSTTILSTKETIEPFSIETNIPTNESTAALTTIETTIKTEEPTTIPSTIKTTIPTSISSTEKVIIPSAISTIEETESKDTTLINNTHTTLPTEINSQQEKDTELVSIESQKTNQMNINTFTQILETTNTNRVIALSTNEIKETLTINSQDNNIINTNLKTNIVSDSDNSDTIFPNITNIEETMVILLDMNLFILHESSFSFNIYFLPVKNYIFSKKLKFPVTVTYYSNIRLLKELEGNCNLNKIYDDSKYEYQCLVETEISNIRQIKINPEFIFISQEDIILKRETPIAKMFMDHVELLIDEKNDKFGNSYIYLLDNSTYKNIYKSIFEIYGSIKDPKPELYENQSLKLMISTVSNNEPSIEANCSVANIKEHNYTLTCKSYEKFSGYLQSAISFIDNNNILLINFDNKYYNKNISFINVDIDNAYRYFKKSEGDNIGTGTFIIAIIIPILVVLAIIIGIVIYLRKKNMNKSNTIEESVIKNFNGKDDLN